MEVRQEMLDTVTAAIDGRDLDALPFAAHMPEGAQGQVILAAAACRRVREVAAEAVAAACGGDMAEARNLMDTMELDLAMMRRHLGAAANLIAGNWQ